MEGPSTIGSEVEPFLTTSPGERVAECIARKATFLSLQLEALRLLTMRLTGNGASAHTLKGAMG